MPALLVVYLDNGLEAGCYAVAGDPELERENLVSMIGACVTEAMKKRDQKRDR